MKRKNRLTIVLSTVIVLILLSYSIIKPSIDQNHTIHNYLNNLLTAVQNKDREQITRLYLPPVLPPEIARQSFDYRLLGWKIRHVDSQPYPMETGSNDVTANIELYYKLPPAVLQPKGEYQEGNYPPYGTCTKYNVALHFHYEKSTNFFMLQKPDLTHGTDMFLPIEHAK